MVMVIYECFKCHKTHDGLSGLKVRNWSITVKGKWIYGEAYQCGCGGELFFIKPALNRTTEETTR